MEAMGSKSPICKEDLVWLERPQCPEEFSGEASSFEQDLQPRSGCRLVKANQHLSSSLNEVTNRLHQKVGKSALATDVLVNAVHTGDVLASIVEEAKTRKVATPVVTTSTTKDLEGPHHKIN